MPKKAMATLADVTDLKTELVHEVENVKASITTAVDASRTKLSAQIGGLDGKLNDHMSKVNEKALSKCLQDAGSYTDEQREAVKRTVDDEVKKMKAHCKVMSDDFDSKLQGLKDEIRDMIALELQGLSAKFDGLLDEVRIEMNDADTVWAGEAAKALVEQNDKLVQDIEDLRQKAEADDVSVAEKTQQALNDALETQRKLDEKKDERQNRANQEIYHKLKQLDDNLSEKIEQLRTETSETHGAHVQKHEQHAASTEERLATLSDDATSLRNAMSEVENISTRRVDWVIKNNAPHQLVFAEVDAAGAYGMQLELQLFRKSDPPVDGEDAGDVAIHLWACKGMKWEKSVVLNKTFNGRVPYGTKRFCFIKDEINKEDDTLRVSVEILEAVREIEHVIKPPPEPIVDPAAPPKTLEELEAEKKIKDKALDGSMFFMRTINNRLYDQVKQQVHVLQSRMVRKVEWRVENASLLRQCFPPDECICSTAFSAAGVEGMQFIFYPSGYKGCTEGYCSLFLFGPAGTTMKCWLAAGSQKREISHTFVEPGAFGRTNFCRFDSCVDEAEDCILISLDIEDAQQDLVAYVKHPAVQPGDRRTLQQIEGSTDKAIESVVKLTKRPGQRSAGKEADLIELRVLPSLWTAKQLGAVSTPADGMHNMADIKIRAQSSSSSRRKGNIPSSVATMMQSSSIMQASSSLPTMPLLPQVRPAIEEDLMLSRSQLPSAHGDVLSSRKVESRRARQRSNLGASLTAVG
eukprot:CAMPEP_0169166140 /NCGR_PEP_ID=MMETSP1015-20121227/59784_1 /TAXON_ID=342587 /ORGANISM="Karlodinium micrum, Strain CCMP2283" /LENGTH=747 /DNA_ID=CAMNT_0009238773 /DNA_START=50 /DNA_END=2295 /DNA_ORIENTATION=+